MELGGLDGQQLLGCGVNPFLNAAAAAHLSTVNPHPQQHSMLVDIGPTSSSANRLQVLQSDSTATTSSNSQLASAEQQQHAMAAAAAMQVAAAAAAAAGHGVSLGGVGGLGSLAVTSQSQLAAAAARIHHGNNGTAVNQQQQQL